MYLALFFPPQYPLRCFIAFLNSICARLCPQSHTSYCHAGKRCIAGMQTQSVPQTPHHVEERKQTDTAK